MPNLPVTEKESMRDGKGASALRQNMDTQTLVHFALIQTNGSEYLNFGIDSRTTLFTMYEEYGDPKIFHEGNFLKQTPDSN